LILDTAAALRQALAALDGGDSARAESLFRAVIAQAPHHPSAYHGLGKALLDELRLEEAEHAFVEAIALEEVPALAQYHLGLCRLLRGDYARGWMGWEKRLEVPSFGHGRYSIPRWTGGKPSGRRLLVVAEQGYGDTIQFSRFLPRLVAEHGMEVTYLCPNPLLAVYRPLSGDRRLAVTDRVPRIEDHDSFVSVGSLAHLLGVHLSDLPGRLPPLVVDPEKVARWREARPRAQRVAGVCWAGRPTHPQDRSRSLPADCLLPLDSVQGLALVGLQRPPCDRPAPPALLDADWGAHIHDFSDLAAMVLALDVVVTVDTAIAHLAGSLGRPTLVMLPYSPDWRWLLGRADSPWYPAARLFRQPRPGDWESVVKAVVRGI
jgi:Tetratricopeptide repeat